MALREIPEVRIKLDAEGVAFYIKFILQYLMTFDNLSLKLCGPYMVTKVGIRVKT
jgi:hypothetical protein